MKDTKQTERHYLVSRLNIFLDALANESISPPQAGITFFHDTDVKLWKFWWRKLAFTKITPLNLHEFLIRVYFMNRNLLYDNTGRFLVDSYI